jgi:hypothetical protein
MAKYGNVSSVPMSLAVFLATDNYDYNDDPNTVSATTLIKPVRQVIMASRVPAEDAVIDLEQMMASRLGSAIHDAIERSWKDNYQQALVDIGIPERVIKNVLINPTKDQLFEGCIPVYLEQRASKRVGKWLVSGKFDGVFDGRVEDFKSTSTYTLMNNTNDEKYVLQGSIYRWLNPEIITRDEMAIQFIFTDWSKLRAMQDPNYPQKRFYQKTFGLKSVQETQAFVERKLRLIEEYWDAPENEIPDCSDSDLWRSDPVFKYYKSGIVSQRSTKNFATRQEAMLRYIEDGSRGLVKEVPGQVTACKYCAGFMACSQKDRLVASGDLVL